MSALRRGFKTWCENAARGYRRELGLAPTAALDPRALAQHLKIIVWSPREVAGLAPEDLHQLTVTGRDEWSALTLRDGDRSLIILNDAHSTARQNNSLAHELGHIILMHEPARMMTSEDGLMVMTDYNPTHEEEAICFAGAILVPREALLPLVKQGLSDSDIATYFQVSTDLARMRRNTTGVEFQLGRRRGTWAP